MGRDEGATQQALRIAILGAGGQIAKGLAEEFAGRCATLYLFSREPSRLPGAHPYSAFPSFEYDLIINAAGPGDPRTIRVANPDVFRITEFFDNLVLDYIAHRSTAMYVFLSTGAVYLNGYAEVARYESRCALPVNEITADIYYPIAKIHAEAKHRALAASNIADIRIFGYFSRYVSLTGGFFLSEVASAIVSGRPLRTTASNFVRDYVCAADIVRLIDCLRDAGVNNGAYDLLSAAPVSKGELLRAMESKFGMQIEFDESSVEGFDEAPSLPFLSDHPAATRVGYRPASTSMEVVESEMRALLAFRH